MDQGCFAQPSSPKLKGQYGGCGSPHQRMRIASSADADRLIKGLEKVMQGTQVEIGLPAAKRLPFLLRKYG